MSKVVLSEYQKEQRKNNYHYFKNGKPKKSAMMCRSREYISELRAINGYFVTICCAGNRCPLYATGCDNCGTDWN